MEAVKGLKEKTMPHTSRNFISTIILIVLLIALSIVIWDYVTDKKPHKQIYWKMPVHFCYETPIEKLSFFENKQCEQYFKKKKQEIKK